MPVKIVEVKGITVRSLPEYEFIAGNKKQNTHFLIF